MLLQDKKNQENLKDFFSFLGFNMEIDFQNEWYLRTSHLKKMENLDELPYQMILCFLLHVTDDMAICHFTLYSFIPKVIDGCGEGVLSRQSTRCGYCKKEFDYSSEIAIKEICGLVIKDILNSLSDWQKCFEDFTINKETATHLNSMFCELKNKCLIKADEYLNDDELKEIKSIVWTDRWFIEYDVHLK